MNSLDNNACNFSRALRQLNSGWSGDYGNPHSGSENGFKGAKYVSFKIFKMS